MRESLVLPPKEHEHFCKMFLINSLVVLWGFRSRITTELRYIKSTSPFLCPLGIQSLDSQITVENYNCYQIITIVMTVQYVSGSRS